MIGTIIIILCGLLILQNKYIRELHDENDAFKADNEELLRENVELANDNLSMIESGYPSIDKRLTVITGKPKPETYCKPYCNFIEQLELTDLDGNIMLGTSKCLQCGRVFNA